jgi:hypothetical protein
MLCHNQCCGSVRDILVRIRVSDQWIRIRFRIRLWILLFSSLTFKTPTKNFVFLNVSAYYFLKVHLNHFSKIKSHKEVTKQ